jgi:hypothetical protein
MMDWNHAQELIKMTLRVGTNLNTPNSTYRFVKKVDIPLHSDAYGYHGERGFVVSIGTAPSAYVPIPWSMLKACFVEAQSPDGYSGVAFRRLYPKQAKVHPCHVHVVGRILEVAGAARMSDGTYRAE